MFGKRAGEFSSPIPLFHDMIIKLAAKILPAKDLRRKASVVCVHLLIRIIGVGGEHEEVVLEQRL